MTKRIMTVDDSASIRQMVGFTLRNAGYEVLETEDGQEALEVLEREPIDMLITDLNMPNVDGISLIKKVREKAETKFIPIIMLTTESQDDKKNQGREAGATGWIVKPFRPDQLINVITKVLP